LRITESAGKVKNGRKKERSLRKKKQRQILRYRRKTYQYLLNREQALVMENSTGRRRRRLSEFLAQLTQTWN